MMRARVPVFLFALLLLVVMLAAPSARPASAAEGFVDSIARLAPVVAFSAAVPHQSAQPTGSCFRCDRDKG